MKEKTQAIEKLWREIGLSITPKTHILLNHIMDQVICFGGIGDNKVEDFVEKSHQANW